MTKHAGRPVASEPKPRKCGHEHPLLNSDCIECAKEIPDDSLASEPKGKPRCAKCGKLKSHRDHDPNVELGSYCKYAEGKND